MCVIAHLPPGTNLDKDHLFNAVHNNWHSWGIVLKDGNGKVSMYKDCPEGGNNPEVIWKMLEDNKDIERALHVRHTTRGETNMENAQPFEVYNSDARQVFFMHNGTLYKFGQQSNYNQVNKGGISDTREFCEKVVQPSLLRWVGDKGKADYSDKLYWDFILKEPWSPQSKGLFVSNDLEPVYIGDGWSRYKNKDGKETEIKVSNTDYFEKITRGPEFDRREAERRAKLAEARPNFQRDEDAPWIGAGETSTTTNGTGAIKKYSPAGLEKSRLVMNALNHIHEDVNFDDPDEIAQTMYNLTYEEICDFFSEESTFTAAALFEKVTESLRILSDQKRDLSKRLARYEKRLTELHLEKVIEDHGEQEKKVA